MRLDVTLPTQSVDGPESSILQKIIRWWNDHNDGTRLWDHVNTIGLNTQGIVTTIVSKTAAYTATATDVVILVDSTGGVVTVTLPTAVGIKGTWYLIKDWKGQAATNNITIATTGGQTIDGAATKVLTKNYLGYFLVSDGANWSIMSEEAVLGNYLPLSGGTLTGNIAFNPTTKGIIGTTTNDNVAAGNVGEYVTSGAVGPTSFAASGTYNDLVSISLTAGDWDVSFLLVGDEGTSLQSQFTVVKAGISQTAGNSTTGLVFGDNHMIVTEGTTGIVDCSLTIAAYRQSLSTTTTIYGKYSATYSAGQPSAFGRLSARRVR